MKTVQGNIQDIQKLAASAPATKPQAAPPVPMAEDTSWGEMEAMDSSDILMPKIYHQQGSSKLVKAGLARAGDFCDSITNEVLAAKDDGIDLIIFGGYKVMLIEEYDSRDDKFRLKQSIRVTPENAFELGRMPFTEEVNGQRVKNTMQYNFYCLLPDRPLELPRVISLASTKAAAAKKLMFLREQLRTTGKNPASVVWHFANKVEQWKKGDSLGFDISKKRNCTDEELARAHQWAMRSQQLVTTEEVEDDGPHY